MAQMLMLDSTSSSGNAEIVMDYIISYTLRKSYENDMPIFQQNCRGILFKLLDMEDEGQKIKNVKVWKQWKRIDLCAEILLDINGIEEKHALLIEDKFYTAPHDNQLERYKADFNDYYDDSWKRHYTLITAIYRVDPQFDKAYQGVSQDGFSIFSINELAARSEKCESDIFNEFWLSDWH